MTDAKPSQTRELHSASTDPVPQTEGSQVVSSVPKLADGHTQEQQDVINYAWEISGGDMRFLYLLTAENGQYTFKRTHPKVAGSIGRDYGLCGINDYYHADVILSPEFFSDWQWQLRKCYEYYTGGVTFYGIIRYDNDWYYRQKIHNKFQ